MYHHIHHNHLSSLRLLVSKLVVLNRNNFPRADKMDLFSIRAYRIRQRRFITGPSYCPCGCGQKYSPHTGELVEHSLEQTEEYGDMDNEEELGDLFAGENQADEHEDATKDSDGYAQHAESSSVDAELPAEDDEDCNNDSDRGPVHDDEDTSHSGEGTSDTNETDDQMAGDTDSSGLTVDEVCPECHSTDQLARFCGRCDGPNLPADVTLCEGCLRADRLVLYCTRCGYGMS